MDLLWIENPFTQYSPIPHLLLLLPTPQRWYRRAWSLTSAWLSPSWLPPFDNRTKQKMGEREREFRGRDIERTSEEERGLWWLSSDPTASGLRILPPTARPPCRPAGNRERKRERERDAERESEGKLGRDFILSPPPTPHFSYLINQISIHFVFYFFFSLTSLIN